MQDRNRRIRPRQRKIVTALGIVGSLALAVVLFLVGLFCIGPMIRSYLHPAGEVGYSPIYAPPSKPYREAASRPKAEEEPALDVEITERRYGDTESSPEPSSDENESSADDRKLSSERSESAHPEDADKFGTSTDSKVERPRTAAEGKPRPAPTESRTHVFRVQAGTFANKTNAENLAADLNEQGYKAEIRTAEVEGRTLYRVQTGEYETRKGAEELVTKLSAKGYSPALVAETRQ